MEALAAGALRLEPLQRLHAAALYPLLADPALYTHMDHGPPASEQALADVYARLESRQSPDGTEQWLNWALIAADGQALGFVQATLFGERQAWIAYMLGRAHWCQGHARLGTQAMIEHLHGRCGVQHLLACVERANLRSLGLLHHLGFEVASNVTAQAHTLTPTEVLLERKLPAQPTWPEP